MLKGVNISNFFFPFLLFIFFLQISKLDPAGGWAGGREVKFKGEEGVNISTSCLARWAAAPRYTLSKYIVQVQTLPSSTSTNVKTA